MLNRKGSTLIESLLAFEIFISVLVLYTGLMTTVFSQEVKINRFYEQILVKEGEISYSEDFVEIAEMALHS
ncbi:hypothetical protein [Candidatus Stoquefichus massiliensis]|uniref:hypothetical protein n=1 Tax=Candidatus Stoquefichus massiliensis TaxID=1470350 RepID=UPI00048A326D|nr:hypothetical protein [Candidatus Stoquefichus massiliensis]